MLSTLNPFDFFTDFDGEALDAGFIFVGQPNQDPVQFPQTVYYDPALTIPAAQPLRTVNGYVMRNGAPTFLFTAANYSILVKDKAERQIYFVADAAASGNQLPITVSDLGNTSDVTKGDALVGVKQPGASTVARTQHFKNADFYSIMDFGNAGQGGDDSAIFAAAALSGKPIWVPAGNYRAENVDVPINAVFFGDKFKSIITHTSGAGTNPIFKCTTGNGQRFIGLALAGNGSKTVPGIDVRTFFVDVADCYLSGFSIGVQSNTGCQALNVRDTLFLNNDLNVAFTDDGRNSNVINNHMEGGGGVIVDKTTTQCEGLCVGFNKILPAVFTSSLSGYGVYVKGGLELLIIGNIIDNVDLRAIELNAVSSPIAYVKIVNNWCGNDGGLASAEGLLAYGTVTHLTVRDNTFASSLNFGIHIGVAAFVAPDRVDLLTNNFLANTNGDIRIEKANVIRVDGNECTHAVAPYREDVNTIVGTVTNNYFPVDPPAVSTNSQFLNNRGSNYGAKWQTYTPAINPTAGAFTTVATSGRYHIDGKTVHFAVRVDITTNGTAAGSFVLANPVPCFNSSVVYTACGREDGITGKMVQGVVGAGGCTVVTYDNLYAGGNGARVFIAGTYEAA